MSSSDEVTTAAAATAAAAAAATGAVGCEKTRWPETVGLTIKEAKKIILEDKPNAKIDVLRVGAATDRMFNPDRVRIFVNTIAQIPRVG